MNQRKILSTLSTAQVVGGIGNGAGLAVGALLIREVTGSTALAGTATFLLTLGAAFMTLRLAKIAARSGRRPALTWGWLLGFLGAVFCILGAQLGQYPIIALGLAGFGSSTAAFMQSRFAATDQAAPDRVGSSLSLVVWSTTIGAVSGPNLIGPGASVAQQLGLIDLAGPMVFSAASFLIAGLITVVFLRPDPLEGQFSATSPPTKLRDAFGLIRGKLLIAVLSVAAAHAVMVSVMTMTPVHMEDHGGSLELIGFTISIHIAGMFGLSPVFGWLTDKLGPAPVIGLGQVIFIASLLLCATAEDDHAQIGVGLVLLGLGWSAAVIAGASWVALLAPTDARTQVQGANDFTMNMAGAGGAALAGVIVAVWSFGALSWVALALVIPVLAVCLSPAARHRVR